MASHNYQRGCHQPTCWSVDRNICGPLSRTEGLLPLHWSIPCFLDVDECSSNNGGCEHACQNQLGSFQCGCEIGYKLDEDRRSCICKCNVCATAQLSSGLPPPRPALPWHSLPCTEPSWARTSAGWSSLALHRTFSSFFTAVITVSSGNDWHYQWKAFPWPDQSCFSHVTQHFLKKHRGFWRSYAYSSLQWWLHVNQRTRTTVTSLYSFSL